MSGSRPRSRILGFWALFCGAIFLFLLVVDFRWRDRPLSVPGCDRAFVHGGVLHLVWGQNCSHYRLPGMCSWHDQLLCGRTHCGGHTTACERQLSNLGTALEMYAEEHQGSYPGRLAELAPAYLKLVPDCPAGMGDCPVNPCAYDYQVGVGRYELICRGDKHSRAGRARDYPRYTSERGLLRGI